MEQTPTITKANRVPFKEYGDFSLHYGGVDDHDRFNYINIRSHAYAPTSLEDDDNLPEREFFMNPYQYFLYRRILFGLEVYPKDEIEWMNPEKRSRIVTKQKMAAEVLNVWRQELMVQYTNGLLVHTFVKKNDKCKSALALILEGSETDIDFICSLTFPQLGITKEMVARKLIEKKLLPGKFFDLTLEDDPRMKILRAIPKPRLDR